jgi:hypothetical protein
LLQLSIAGLLRCYVTTQAAVESITTAKARDLKRNGGEMQAVLEKPAFLP